MSMPNGNKGFVTTGSDGVAEIVTSKRRPYLLTVEHVGPPSHAELADHDEFSDSLSFDTSIGH